MSITRSVAATESPPSVEQVRKQAKRRLMGVAVLVLAAVVVFPLLFDTQPRPVPVDMPIEIPSRKVSKPLQVDAPAVTEAAVPVAASESVAPPAARPAITETRASDAQPVVKDKAKTEPEEVIIESTPARKPVVAEAKPLAKSDSKPEAKAEPALATAPSVSKAIAAAETAEKKSAPPVAKPAPEKAAAAHPAAAANSSVPTAPAHNKDADAARAQALLEGKPAPAANTAATDSASPRFIVQVGAFADAAVAQAARDKLERTGLKTYTHVAQLPEGKRTRVRLGPFATKAEAEKAAGKAKAQGLPVAILTL